MCMPFKMVSVPPEGQNLDRNSRGGGGGGGGAQEAIRMTFDLVQSPHGRPAIIQSFYIAVELTLLMY